MNVDTVAVAVTGLTALIDHDPVVSASVGALVLTGVVMMRVRRIAMIM